MTCFNRFNLLLAILVLGAGCAQAPQYEETENRQRDYWQDAFEKRIVRLSPAGEDKVYIQLDDGFVHETFFEQKPPGYILEVADEFYSQGDHSINYFQVEEIQKHGVVILYESQFDERSFGKNTILIDRGTIQLGWK